MESGQGRRATQWVSVCDFIKLNRFRLCKTLFQIRNRGIGSRENHLIGKCRGIKFAYRAVPMFIGSMQVIIAVFVLVVLHQQVVYFVKAYGKQNRNSKARCQ